MQHSPRQIAVGAAPGTVGAVLALVAIVPSAPLLVPELAGPDATDTDAVRTAVQASAVRLGRVASRWVAVGAADPGTAVADAAHYRAGDFGAYGVPVPVSLSPEGAGGTTAPGSTPLPLSMLIAGWVRGQADRPVVVTPVVVDPSATPAECTLIGQRLAADIEATDEPVGLLVVADGANALTPSAPGGGERASAAMLQERMDEAIARADTSALAALTAAECDAEGVRGRPALQVAGGLVDGGVRACSVEYTGAPFGVGYTVAVWTPAGSGA